MQKRLVPVQIKALGDNEVDIRMSTGEIGRDGHVLVPTGADLTNYKTNPIMLWQHDPGSPVGRAEDIRVDQDAIAARVTFAPDGVSAKADEIRGLVKSEIINAVSVGFEPLEGDPLDPRKPRGGQRFSRWELLECSFVSVPADPRATVTARELERADGADKKPSGDYGDVKYADPGYQDDKKPRYPLDTAEHIKAAWNYIHKEKNAGEYSAEQVAKIEAKIIAAWKEKIDPKGPPSARATYAHLVRDLSDCAWLANIVECLACIEDMAEDEADEEGDNSPIPARLTEVLKTLGAILVDMTVEEVAELLDEENTEDMGSRGQRALRALGHAMARPAVLQIETPAVRELAAALTRAGKVLSAENERCLRDAHGAITRGCDMIRSVVDQAMPATAEMPRDESGGDELGRARAAAKARLIELQRK